MRYFPVLMSLLVAASPAAFAQSQAEPAQDDFVSASVRRSDAFAVELVRRESASGKENGVVCPGGVRRCLMIAAASSAGSTRAEFLKAAMAPTDVREMEAEALALQRLKVFTEMAIDSSAAKPDPARLKYLERYFGLSHREVSFANPEKALSEINTPQSWSSASSGTDLPVPFTASDLAPSADRRGALLLTSRTHFKSLWDKGFSEEFTWGEKFFPESGEPVGMPMMHQDLETAYVAMPDGEAVSLAYNASPERLILVLPKAGVTPAAWLSGPSFGKLSEWVSRMTTHEVKLTLPRFKVRHSPAVETHLREMGVRSAFDAAKADFSPLLTPVRPGEHLALGGIRQDSLFIVNERGTEAGSVTGMSFCALFGEAPKPKYPQVTVRFDRPFVFVLLGEGGILYAGWCGRPDAAKAEEVEQSASRIAKFHEQSARRVAKLEEQQAREKSKRMAKELMANIRAAARALPKEQREAGIPVSILAPQLKVAEGRSVRLTWEVRGEWHRASPADLESLSQRLMPGQAFRVSLFRSEHLDAFEEGRIPKADGADESPVAESPGASEA